MTAPRATGPARRRAAWVAAPLVALLAPTLAACTGDDGDAAPTPPPTSTATPTPPPTAPPVPEPETDACYDLTYRQAVSPTAPTSAEAVPCDRPHTAETIEVGPLDNLANGHLLAVDSQQVQDAVARDCPARFADVVGGSAQDQQLSVLRPLWFTPSLEESSLGASWFRCDVVALAGADELATVRGSLAGVLDTEEGRERWAMCGTAGPDEQGFERVPCSAEHSWRAFDVVDLAGLGDDYPGAEAIRDEASPACEDAAAAVAADPLDYQWGFDGPDEAQWQLGQRFARCWTPD